jgi:hypothetical protein
MRYQHNLSAHQERKAHEKHERDRARKRRRRALSSFEDAYARTVERTARDFVDKPEGRK